MREYKKVKKGTEVTKVLCDTCKKEIPMLGSGKRVYVPSAKLITARRKYSYGQWSDDTFDFCSLECFLEWAEGEPAPFDVSFPRDVLDNLVSEYARLESGDSRLTALVGIPTKNILNNGALKSPYMNIVSVHIEGHKEMKKEDK